MVFQEEVTGRQKPDMNRYLSPVVVYSRTLLLSYVNNYADFSTTVVGRELDDHDIIVSRESMV